MTLKDLKEGEKGFITKIKGEPSYRKRLLEMGFIVGQEVEAVKKAPLKDPVDYKIMGYEVSLRNSEALLIDIIRKAEAKKPPSTEFSDKIEFIQPEKITKTDKKTIDVALVGNPNCGKTTIFNYASASKERVGNYCGVTVEAKEAKIKYHGYTLNLIDLPGTYSITAYSPEELYIRSYILNHKPDVVINVVDVNNLERNLYLTTQLIDMQQNVIVALNMYDEFIDSNSKLDHNKLGEFLGTPMVPTIGPKGKGIKELFRRAIDIYEGKEKQLKHVKINHGVDLENSIDAVQNVIEKTVLPNGFPRRFVAIKLIEKDNNIKERVEYHYKSSEPINKADEEIDKLEKKYNSDTETIITDTKYKFIKEILQKTLKKQKSTKTQIIKIVDHLSTHKYLGIPIFFSFLWLTFYVTFNVGQYPMEWIESSMGWLSNIVGSLMQDGMLKSFLVDGLIGGVGGVLVFLPNIVLLYFFISLMEDSGYMARVVFIMDKVMSKIGLNGKSFIPLLMGFGCNVPAIMSARIVDDKKDRLITMLINPFMSCSARLPVYVLFISAFFVNYQATILFSLYFMGVVVAIISALVFKKTLFKKSFIPIPFVVELPPYRFPTAKGLLKQVSFSAVQYLKKLGGTILIASIIIWVLNYFPQDVEYSKNYEQMKVQTEKEFVASINSLDDISDEKINQLREEKEQKIQEINLSKQAEKQEKSFIGMLGKTIEPVFEPVGFDWKMTVAILTGLAAKEVVVSTLGVLYQSGEDDVNTLAHKLREQSSAHSPDGKFTPSVALAFMVFILLYFPCVGVIAAMRKESGSWKWPVFTIVYSTSLAWFAAFVIFQIGKIL